ncbi:sugar transferase [Candidatus Pelagibacter bacterium]|nr:sugar transferase [Candidatus Pelagibacter bacterium]|tara:strand:+ start:107 stop:664 length:558 start_codon:yes stop_codon:yes gene_type:complete
MKRVFDVLISTLILTIFFPIMIIISMLIFVIEGRPIIYKQLRVGYKGRKFIIFKYRTMSNIIFKDEKLRLSYLGKILRKTSLDELPQLINVLKKDMSIVGPRPLPEIIEKKIKKSLKMKRRKILPGITGMSQINFTGKDRKLNDKIQLDMQLIDNYTIYNYFKILLKTPIILIVRFFKNKSSIIK